MNKKITLVIVLILIVLTYPILSVAENSSIDNLKNQSEETKKQLQQTEKEKEEVNEELTKNLQELQKLDEKIQNMETELNRVKSEIEDLTKEINENEKQLKEATEKYEVQKKLLEERLVVLYEAGEIEYIDVLFKSSSMSEFITNYYLITEIITYDTELLESVENQRKTIENTKIKLDNQRNELIIKKQNQEKSVKVLENTKTVRKGYVSKLSEEEKELQNKIDEYNNSINEIEREIAALARQNSSSGQAYTGGVMAWPVPGYTRITSKYGMRVHPITGVYKLHSGIDIGAPTGADFVAAASGVIAKAAYSSSYGNMVIINHGGGVQTLYAHGSKILVQTGQTVAKGEAILKVGSTGYSTGPHAHFEVRINGATVDPLPYITSK